MTDHITIDTRILGYAHLPFENASEVDYWFNPRTVIEWRGGVPCRVAVGPPRMSQRERERYLAEESHNLIINNGRLQIITYIGTNGAYGTQFGNILSLGNGTVSSIGGGSVEIGEYYRIAPTAQIYTGSTQVDIQSTVTGSNGNGTITNIAIWGGGATTTLGTGGQVTLALFSLVKVTSTVVIDYVITLS